MADLQKTVEIVFGGRNELSKTIGQVEASLSSLNTATQPFADLAVNVLKAEAALIGMGVAAAGISIATAGEFAGQFAEITTLIDDSADSLDTYRQAILDYSSESTQSLDQINGALYAAISAGVDYSDSLDAIRVAETLAVAGKADLESTMIGLVSTLNAYGAGMDEAEDYADIFFTTVKEGQTTIPELNASLAQVTSVAAAAGVPFEDLGAAIAALTASGMPTSQAITSIKAALSNIIKPTADAKTVAEELGIQFNSTALEAMGLNGFLEMVWEATDGNIDVMSRLFGSVEGLAGVLSLAGGESGKFAAALEAMETRTGSTSTAFEKMVDNFGLQNQNLANNVRIALVSVGDQLLDGYGDIISALTSNLQGITQAVNAGDFDGLIGLFEGVMQDIATLLEGTAQILPEAIAKIDWGNLTSSFDSLKTAIQSVLTAMFGEVDLSNVDSLAAGMQKFVDAIASLTNINAGIIGALPGFFAAIVEVLERVSKLSPEQFESIGKGLGAALLINVSTGLVSNMATTIAAFAWSVKALAGVNVAGLGTLAGALGKLGLIGGAAYVGFEIGTWLEEQVYRFRNAADDLSSTDLNVMMPTFDNQGLIDGFDEVERVARETAFETGKIKWELDADGNIAGTVTKLTDSIESVTGEVAAEFDRLKQHYIDMGNSPQIAAAMARIESETQRIPKAMEDAASETKEQSDALILGLAKIDSDFAGKALELKVSLDLAQLESDTKIAEAIIGNIGTAIQSTGDLLGSLFDNLTGAKGANAGFGDKWLIEDQIKEENRRRDEAFDMQRDMTDAQIAMMEARTKAMQNGDAMIKISSDGLEPVLEMILWHFVEKIQLRINEEGSAMLTGI